MRTVQLKNGETVTIRQATTEDAAALLQAIGSYIADADYFLTTPSEFTVTLEQEREWIESFTAHPDGLLLIALHGTGIIGNLDITPGKKKRIAHTAMVGMGMKRAWRNTGLGTALMQTAISWAKEKSSIELLWLQVFGNNSAAIGLYQKMGFKEEGRQTGFFKLENGTTDDNVIMSLRIGRD